MLARGIIGAIEPRSIEPSLRGAEIQRAGRKRPENLNAYDLYLRALPHAYAYTSEGRTLAIELLERALAINSSYAQSAWSCRMVPHPALLG